MAIYKLNNLITVKDNYRSSDYPKPNELLNSGIPFVKTADFKNGYINTTKECLSLQKFYALPEKGKVKYNDLLISAYGTIDTAIFKLEKGQLSSGIKILECNEKKILKKFLFYWLKKNIKQIGTISSVFKQLTINEIYSLKLNLPSLMEQQRIIDIIEPIEKKINLLNLISEKIILLLEKHYNLLNGHLVKFQTIAKIFIGGTPSTSNILFWNGKIPWINSGKLTNHVVSKKAEKYITELGLTKSSLANKYDVLFSIIDPDSFKVSFASETTAFNQSIARIESNKKLFFEIRNAMNYFKLVKNGAAQQSINKNLIENALLKLVDVDYSNAYEFIFKINEIRNCCDDIKTKLINLLIK